MKDGRRFTLADEIDSRQEARWVVSQIETLAGMKLDTHVEVDLPLGVSPQPGTQMPGQIFTRSGQRVNSAASMVVFCSAGRYGWLHGVAIDLIHFTFAQMMLVPPRRHPRPKQFRGAFFPVP